MRVREPTDLERLLGGADPSSLGALLEACAPLGLTPLPQNVDSFVEETFVLPVRHAATAVRIDFIFSSTAYERQAIQRAQPVTLAGEAVPFATAEDLIIHKLFAARPRDLATPTSQERFLSS